VKLSRQAWPFFLQYEAYGCELFAALQNRGLPVSMHGDMKQIMRTRVMNRFKAGEIRFLVATDVAARGIDVDEY
jgi:ATP-dependent RNA helicase DeaD